MKRYRQGIFGLSQYFLKSHFHLRYLTFPLNLTPEYIIFLRIIL